MKGEGVGMQSLAGECGGESSGTGRTGLAPGI